MHLHPSLSHATCLHSCGCHDHASLLSPILLQDALMEVFGEWSSIKWITGAQGSCCSSSPMTGTMCTADKETQEFYGTAFLEFDSSVLAKVTAEQ